MGENDWALPPEIFLRADGRDLFLFGTSALPVLSERMGGKEKRRDGFKLRCVAGMSAACVEFFLSGRATSLPSLFSTGDFVEDIILK